MPGKDYCAILHQAAIDYQDNFLGRIFVFVYLPVNSNGNVINFSAAMFHAENFMHLTGLSDLHYMNILHMDHYNASDFFNNFFDKKVLSRKHEINRRIEAYLSGRPTFTDIVEKKFSILEQLPSLMKTMTSVGTYSAEINKERNGGKGLLYTQLMLGGGKSCLGFVKSDKHPNGADLVPNTAIVGNLNNYIDPNSRSRMLYILSCAKESNILRCNRMDKLEYFNDKMVRESAEFAQGKSISERDFAHKLFGLNEYGEPYCKDLRIFNHIRQAMLERIDNNIKEGPEEIVQQER